MEAHLTRVKIFPSRLASDDRIVLMVHIDETPMAAHPVRVRMIVPPRQG